MTGEPNPTAAPLAERRWLHTAGLNMLDVLDRLFELVVNNLGLIAVGIMCLVVIVGWWTTTHMPHYPEPPCCR
ncbi:MAG: hypothetical protein QOK39_1742 [Acidimicrobiaceae bacterium]|nr:hypothetical protein [Acidimicrobiaceae bacterium]